MSDTHLMDILKLAAEYCATCENANNMEKKEFVDSILLSLPKLYWNFLDLTPGDLVSLEESDYFSTYMDEDYYDSLRRRMEAVIGEDDTFLETFEEDMKYSDTPIAASISESLADIYQPLYDFLQVAKDTEGAGMPDAYAHCREEFDSYWSQTLCNVMRALNRIRTEV